MFRVYAVSVASCLVACATAPAPKPPERSQVEVLNAALPGVVLLITQRPDGKVGYGSGILLDEHGLVLTNVHVVANAKSISALLYDPQRTSYIPDDGGLARYLFENEKSLLAARLEKADPALDLAIVRVEADTSKYPRLPWRSGEVQVGEKVIALGHPKETVWSFSTGVVSSLHSAVIQTDAAINQGNSGGPLIDAEGRLVGINTSKLVGDAQGIGFARPVKLARELIDGARAPFEPDLSSPEKGVVSCARASELASTAIVNCEDDESAYDLMIASMEGMKARIKLAPEAARAMDERIQKFGKEQWANFRHQLQIASVKGQSARQLTEDVQKKLRSIEVSGMAAGELEKKVDAHLERDDVVKEIRKAIDELGTYKAEWDQQLLERTGLKLDRKNPRAALENLKMGIRVDQVKELEGGRAWVAISGRNVDGTPYRYSELWVKRGETWKERGVPLPSDVDSLPPGFPLPVSEYARALEISIEAMIKGMSERKPK